MRWRSCWLCKFFKRLQRGSFHCSELRFLHTHPLRFKIGFNTVRRDFEHSSQRDCNGKAQNENEKFCAVNRRKGVKSWQINMQSFDDRVSYERVENGNAKDLASFEFEEEMPCCCLYWRDLGAVGLSSLVKNSIGVL